MIDDSDGVRLIQLGQHIHSLILLLHLLILIHGIKGQLLLPAHIKIEVRLILAFSSQMAERQVFGPTGLLGHLITTFGECFLGNVDQGLFVETI